jgi:hypothetical protein
MNSAITDLNDYNKILKDELRTIVHATALHMSDTADLNLTAQLSRKNALISKIKENTESINALSLQPLEEMRKANSQQDSRNRTLTIAGQVTKFKLKDEPNRYWQKFEDVCRLNRLDDPESTHLLRHLLVEHPSGPHFFSSEILTLDKEATLAETKKLFQDFFLSSTWRSERLQQLFEIRFKKNESVREFVERFSSLVRDNELKFDSTEPAHQWVKNVLYYKVPPSVQRILLSKKVQDYPSCKELAQDLILFVGFPEDIPMADNICTTCGHKVKCVSCQTHLGAKRPKSSNPDANMDIKSKAFCETHGWCAHATIDCKSSKSTGSVTHPEPSQILCSRSHSLQIWVRKELCAGT